jgi:hypothetical protein
MENIPDFGWLLIFYAAGTVIGYFWGFKRGVFEAAEKAIDALISQGFLKSKKNALGQQELIKPRFDE